MYVSERLRTDAGARVVDADAGPGCYGDRPRVGSERDDAAAAGLRALGRPQDARVLVLLVLDCNVSQHGTGHGAFGYGHAVNW